MAKLGEDMLGEMAQQGLEELRAANSGQMAMDAPPIQPIEQESYGQMVEQQAAMAEAQVEAPDQGMSR